MHQFLSGFSRSTLRVELNGVGVLVKETRRDAWHEFSSHFETRREGKTCAWLGRLIRYSRRPAIGAMVIINALNTRIRACVRARSCERACSCSRDSRTRWPLSLNALHNSRNRRGIVAWRLYTRASVY